MMDFLLKMMDILQRMETQTRNRTQNVEIAAPIRVDPRKHCHTSSQITLSFSNEESLVSNEASSISIEAS